MDDIKSSALLIYKIHSKNLLYFLQREAFTFGMQNYSKQKWVCYVVKYPDSISSENFNVPPRIKTTCQNITR